MSNTSGQATAFMALTPIRAGEEPALRSYLASLSQAESPLALLAFFRGGLLGDPSRLGQ